MDVGGHRKIGKPKLRWSDVAKKIHEGDRSKYRRSTILENVEI